MQRSEGREQGTKDELGGRRRHYWNALRNPKTLFYSQTQKKLVLFPNRRNTERQRERERERENSSTCCCCSLSYSHESSGGFSSSAQPSCYVGVSRGPP